MSQPSLAGAEPPDVPSLLARLPLFQELSPEQIGHIADACAPFIQGGSAL
jgi:hypothetical protein